MVTDFFSSFLFVFLQAVRIRSFRGFRCHNILLFWPVKQWSYLLWADSLNFILIWTCRFSLAWWAYTFPLSGAATAAIKYSNEVTNIVTRSLSITLSAVATFTVAALLITTILHAFVLQDLFPNDIAIAISEKRRKTRKRHHLRTGTSDTKDIENFPKFGSPKHMGIEASLPSCKREEV